MRSRWNLPIYLVYLVISLVVIGFIVAQMGLRAPWSHQYTVTAQFSDAADILVNNEVYMNGTKVGHVGAVTVRDGVAEVQMVIDNPNALPLHADATAEVRKKNLLGETYIDLQRGGDATLMSDGGTIPVSQTIPITEIDQVLAIFDPETVQRVQLLINALGNATVNNGQTMNQEAATTNALITELNAPAVELSVRQQQVQDIVLELQRFYSVLAGQRSQVLQEFGTWNQVMGQLANQESSIGGTVRQANTLLQNLNALVSGESGNLRATLDSLPVALADTNSFLDQSNTIITAIAPYRQYINDVFPDLETSFADTDANGQHFWSVFSVNCYPDQCAGAAPSSDQQGTSGSFWAAYGGAS
ncbi:MAG: MCE family protein [Candidatus Dormibacteraeota bacterium]|nr:MCE family protein [Candidatus Dormibacteraeota bacterium]